MIKKAKIEDTIYDVITYKEYAKNREAYSKYSNSIAIEDSSGYILPIRTMYDTRPGFFPAQGTSGIDFFRAPSGRDCATYSAGNIINFSEAKSLKGVIEAQNKLNKAERSILISIDNITIPEIYDNDTPFMKAIKTAIIKKKIDLDKYGHRFGFNFANDKRLLKKDDMTQQKGITFANCLDFDMFMIFKDKSPDVPNPMGEPIIIKLTGDGAGFYDGFSNEEIEEVTSMATNYPNSLQPAAYDQNYYNQVIPMASYGSYPYIPYVYPPQAYYNPWYQYGMYWGGGYQ